VKPNFDLTTAAKTDLRGIWTHIESEESEAVASKVVARIIRECRKLGDIPGLGHYREELLNKSCRFWRVWSYLIVYRWEVSPIEIIAVVHGARDLEEFFSDNPR
jgi:plasmid stabilization system protein ParE